MGLEGFLEDLAIGDILQIISLSKKSGTLTLKSGRELGTISFIDGQVVRASSTQFKEELGQLLCRMRLATADQVTQAVERQRMLEVHQPLGTLLAEMFQISRDAIETVVQRQIELIVFSFFHWKEGTFFFQLEEPQVYGSAAVNPFDFMLENGINPQWLVVKGEKIAEQGEVVFDEDDLKTELARRIRSQDEKGLPLFMGMLAELENTFLGGGIILLILRYASEIMSRAVIFDVRGKLLVGLGQFGLTGLSASADEIVRKMRLNVEENSTFAQAINRQVPIKTSLGNTSGERILQEVLGGVPDEVFLGPLVSEDRVIALLYGDNFPTQATLDATRSFEVFLSQAGLAMEQALQDQPN